MGADGVANSIRNVPRDWCESRISPDDLLGLRLASVPTGGDLGDSAIVVDALAVWDSLSGINPSGMII